MFFGAVGLTSVPCGAPVGAGRVLHRAARARAWELARAPGCRRGCPLRGAARPRPRRRGRAAATAGDAREAEVRPGLRPRVPV